MSQQQEQQQISKEKLDELTGKTKNENKNKGSSKQHHNSFFKFLSNFVYVCAGFIWDYSKAFVNIFIPNKNDKDKNKIKIVDEPKHEKEEENGQRNEASPEAENANDSEQFNSRMTFQEEEESADNSETAEPIIEFPPEDEESLDTEGINACCGSSFSPTTSSRSRSSTLS